MTHHPTQRFVRVFVENVSGFMLNVGVQSVSIFSLHPVT